MLKKKKTNRSKCKPIKTHTSKHKDYSKMTNNCLNAVFNSLWECYIHVQVETSPVWMSDGDWFDYTCIKSLHTNVD